MAADSKHDELIYTLAAHLKAGGWVCFPNVTLGSAWGNPSTGRADLLAMKPSYNRHQTSIFEVKVTRADFLGDVRSGKFERYKPFCSRLTFATPAGLVTKAEIPEGCGLITTKDGQSWHALKAATPSNYVPDAEMLLACIFSAHPAGWKRGRKLRGMISWNPEAIGDEHDVRDLEARLRAAKNRKTRVLSKRFGREVARKLALVEESEEALLKAINTIRIAMGEGRYAGEGDYIDVLDRAAHRAARKLDEAKRNQGSLLHLAAARLIESVIHVAFPHWGEPDVSKIDVALKAFRAAGRQGVEEKKATESDRERLAKLKDRVDGECPENMNGHWSRAPK